MFDDDIRKLLDDGGFANVQWPKACLGCGSEHLESATVYYHEFKSLHEEPTFTGKKIHYATCDSILYLCESCLKRAQERTEKDLRTSFLRNPLVIGFIAVVLGFLLPLLLRLMADPSMLSVVLFIVGAIGVGLILSAAMQLIWIRRFYPRLMENPVQRYVFMDGRGHFIFTSTDFQYLFSLVNPSRKTYLKPKFFDSNISSNYGVPMTGILSGGCCLAIILVFASLFFWVSLLGPVVSP